MFLCLFSNLLYFLDVVQVIPPDDSGPVHLKLGHNTSEDTSTDGHLSGEGTLLVDVVSHAGLSWGLEAKSRVAHEPGLTGLESTLPVQVDGGLLLESPLILIGHSDFSLVEVNQAIKAW